MRSLVLSAIRFYQRRLSPHKGFSCAVRVHGGKASCSALGYRAIRRHGLRQGLGILRDRLEECGETHRTWQLSRRRSEAGECDLPCDLSCDMPDCGDWACDLLPEFCGDWLPARKTPRKSRKRKGEEPPPEEEPPAE